MELGYTFFDTAECYIGEDADGNVKYNEELVGDALKPYRNQVKIATKFGVAHSPNGLITDSRPETIPGSRKIERLSENAWAAELKLSAEEIAEIDRQLEEIETSGVFGGTPSRKE